MWDELVGLVDRWWIIFYLFLKAVVRFSSSHHCFRMTHGPAFCWPTAQFSYVLKCRQGVKTPTQTKPNQNPWPSFPSAHRSVFLCPTGQLSVGPPLSFLTSHGPTFRRPTAQFSYVPWANFPSVHRSVFLRPTGQLSVGPPLSFLTSHGPTFRRPTAQFSYVPRANFPSAHRSVFLRPTGQLSVGPPLSFLMSHGPTFHQPTGWSATGWPQLLAIMALPLSITHPPTHQWQ